MRSVRKRSSREALAGVRTAAQREKARQAAAGFQPGAAERHQAGNQSHPEAVNNTPRVHAYRRCKQGPVCDDRSCCGDSRGGARAVNPADPSVVFTDITAATGITFSHVSASEKKYIVESMSGGVALFDFDKRWLARRVPRELADGGDRRQAEQAREAPCGGTITTEHSAT